MPWVTSRALQPRDIDKEIATVDESRCILAACRPEQDALEVSDQGVFTAALTDGLLGDAVDFDGNVSVFSLHAYVASVLNSPAQVPVFKGDAAGAVILGGGFEPRRGRPLKGDELALTLAKGASLLDEYYRIEQKESADRSYRNESGAKRCASELESRLDWFRSTEEQLPDVVRQPEWQALRGRLREHQGRLSSLSIGENTRYGRVAEKLGHGGYGHVWRLQAPGTEDAAFKVFHGNELDDAVKVARFQNGYGNMRKLDHPRIVRVRELTHAPFGFLMDAIPGPNLRDAYWDRQDSEAVLRLLIDIAETVEHAHNRGVRHRDIKPENVIVSLSDEGQPVPYLTDFDLAYHETNRTVTTNLGVGGVLNYAAPEQLYTPNSQAARAPTVDVFSLAQLMFYVISREDPVPENPDRNIGTLSKILSDWVDARAAETIGSLYEASTKRDSALRPQTVTEFIVQLTRAETYALSSSGRDAIDEDDFCRQLGHAYRGIGNYAASTDSVTMHSLSQQIEMRVVNTGLSDGRLGHIDLEVEMSVTTTLPVGSFSSGAGGRKAINTRLDRSLSKYHGVTRHAGTHGVFQTHLHLKKVPLTLEGLAFVQNVLGAAVAAIEQW